MFFYEMADIKIFAKQVVSLLLYMIFNALNYVRCDELFPFLLGRDFDGPPISSIFWNI